MGVGAVVRWLCARVRGAGQVAKATPEILARWWEQPVGVVVPLLGLTVMLLAPQAPDMLAGMRMHFDGGEAAASWWSPLALGVAAALLGVCAWYWTRAALMAPLRVEDGARMHDCGCIPARAGIQGDNAAEIERAYVWAPRVALAAAGVLAALPALLAPRVEGFGVWTAVWQLDPMVLAAAGNLLMVVLAFLGVVHRHRLVDAIGRGTGGGLPWGAAAWMWRTRTTGVFAAAPFGWPVALVLLGLSLLGIWLVAAAPELIETHLHTPTAAVGALALLVGPLVLALALVRDASQAVLWLLAAPLDGLLGRRPGGFAWLPRLLRRPWLADAVGLLLVVGWLFLTPFGGPDNARYHVRAAEPFAPVTAACGEPDRWMPPHGADPRPCLGEAVRDWHAEKRRVLDWPADRPMPMIVVAAEGGASRSAVWTLAAMRLLDDQTDGAFGRHLFAVIGVSGGSLGAATYLQALAAYPGTDPGCADDPDQAACPPRPWLDWDAPEVERGLIQLAQGDLLAPSIATYFLNDTLARLFGPLMHGVPARDVALERSFERHWAWDAGFGLDPAQARAALLPLHWELGPGAPHLLLSGTDGQSGGRLLTSTFRFSAADDLFPSAGDQLAMMGHDVPVSTAVTNSARFPFISPAGRFLDRLADPGASVGRQVIDGGFFENYGARTARELVVGIARTGAAPGRPPLDLAPIVVVISNPVDAVDASDPAARDSDAPADTLQDTVLRCGWTAPVPDRCTALAEPGDDGADDDEIEDADARAVGFLPQLLAPMVGLVATRSAHGQSALHDLRRRMCRGGTGDRLFNLALPAPDRSEGEAAPMNWVMNLEARHFMLDVAPKVPFNRDAQAGGLDRLLAALRTGGTFEAVEEQTAARDCPGGGAASD